MLLCHLQALETDLTDHQNLLHEVALQVPKVAKSRSPGADDDTEPTPDAINANWRQLSRQLSEKKQQLQDTIDRTRPQVRTANYSCSIINIFHIIDIYCLNLFPIDIQKIKGTVESPPNEGRVISYVIIFIFTININII